MQQTRIVFQEKKEKIETFYYLNVIVCKYVIYFE